jgi:hypothetical protein
MNNPISDFTDEFVELGSDLKKSFIRDVVKGIPQTVKQQVTGDNGNKANEGDKDSKSNKNDGRPDKNNRASETKVDPVTGLPVPKKVQLQHLNQATAQLTMTKLKQVREELEKQRLKVAEEKDKLSPLQLEKTKGKGPVIAVDSSEREKKDDSVAVALKGSKNTGEFKGLVGG